MLTISQPLPNINQNMGETTIVNCKDRLAANAWKLIILGHTLPHFTGKEELVKLLKKCSKMGYGKTKKEVERSLIKKK